MLREGSMSVRETRTTEKMRVTLLHKHSKHDNSLDLEGCM